MRTTRCPEKSLSLCWCCTCRTETAVDLCRTWRAMTNGIHRNFSAVRPASTCHCTSPRSYSSHSSSANLQSHKATVQRSSSSTRASKGQVTSHRQTYGQRVATMARAVPTAQETTRTLRSTGPTIAEGRQMLLDSIALESFKMTGVSFKGRQDLVSKLHPGKATATCS